MDTIDRKILSILQRDATIPIAEIADQVGLSTTPCWRRIRKLEEAGVIRRRVALLDARKMNLGVTVFVSLKTGRHSADWLEKFAATVAGIELLAAAQGIEFRRPLTSSAALEQAHALIRAEVPALDQDRHFAPDPEAVHALVVAGAFNDMMPPGILPSLS